MSREIKRVRLELLRAGPPHNQLLSPLTDYLCLCGDHEAAVVNVPWEHRQFMRRLEQLRYPDRGTVGDKEQQLRLAQLEEMADKVGEILAAVPGLPAAQASGPPGGRLTHLEIVHSAGELALLPFELSKVPAGFPGTPDDWLSVDSAAPVCITRTMRSISGEGVCWPLEPRILFVSGSPRGMTVPLQEHAHALLAAIQPWLEPYDTTSPEAHRRAVERVLTVLPKASIRDVEKACAETAFTHVHVLAHGVPHEGEEGRPFGLALHAPGADDDVEVVTGRRFAAALRHGGAAGAAGPPCVATLASCDSGNVGDVVFSGASFAHELHRGGIPLVVASQYPLSFAGSVLLVRTLYERLLWGEDPRQVLMDLRQRLFALHSNKTHDWASMVAYAALPQDLSTQLEASRYVQARRAIDARLGWTVRAARGSTAGGGASRAELKQLLERVDEAAGQLPDSEAYFTEISGLKGSAHKQSAQALFEYAARLAEADGSAGDESQGRQHWALDRMWKELERSLRRYRDAAQAELGPPRETRVLFPTLLHWVLTQFLSLNAILGRKFLEHHWHAAVLSARAQLVDGSGIDRLWGHGSLAELYLLPLAVDEPRRPIPAKRALREIREHAEAFAEMAPPAVPGEFNPTASTVRQFRRYLDWWGHPLFELAMERQEAQRPPWDAVREGVELVVERLSQV